MNKLDKFLIACGFIGPIVLYATIYFLFDLITPGYDAKTRYISDLGASDSPIRTLANVFGFSLVGIFIILFSFGVFRLKEVNFLIKISAALFLITGILMYLVGIFPKDAGLESYSIRGNLHNKVADYQFPVLAIGLIIFAIGALFNNKIRFLTPIVLGLGVICLILASRLFGPPPPPLNVGILQRAAIGLPYFILLIIAGSIYKQMSK